MAGIVRVNGPDPFSEYVNAPDEVYGPGVDGDVEITTATTLTSDMFYNNLTIADSTHLNTNGYRVFVKNLLTLGENSSLGLIGGFSGSGSVMGGAEAGYVATNSLGGNGAAGSAVAPTAASGGSIYYRMASQAVKGYQLTAGLTEPLFLRGGSGGNVGQGDGGGVVIVAARYVTGASGSAFVATGGTNAGGGVVILVSTDSKIITQPSANVSGNGVGTDGTYIYIEVD